VAVIAVGIFYATRSNSGQPPGASAGSSQTQSSVTAPKDQTAAATITFTGDGFTPAVTTVKAGDTVRVANKSSQPLNFDSDPHPTHTDEPELNVGAIGPGESGTFTVTKKGHWGFHDHLNPSLRGTLIVE
jgi:plastocyanin